MNYTLHLAHINDTHSHFEPSLLHFNLELNHTQYRLDIPCGGYANVASALQQHRLNAKQAQQNSLFLHAGDSFQGSLYFSCFKGQANATLLNYLQPDAMTIGNHEFDLGNTPVSDFLSQINFPMLAGNMDLSQEDQTKEAPLRPHKNLYFYDNNKKIANYLIKSLRNDNHQVPIAIVGITLDLMQKIGCPDPDCHFLDAISTTRATINHLHQQGIKHIIVLSHLGYLGDLELAEQVDGISVIVGGHTHTLSGDFSSLNIPCTGEADQRVNNTLILHGGQHAESMGLCQITFDQKGVVSHFEGGVKFLINNEWQAFEHQQVVTSEQHQEIARFISSNPCFHQVESDQYVEQLIATDYRPAVAKMRKKVVATLSQPLTHVRLPTSDLPFGSEIAPLVAQGFYHSAQQKRNIDFALHNAGGVRVSIKDGPLTVAEISGRLLPFAIPIISYLISGKQLKLALEGAINNATNNGIKGSGNGSYPYTHYLKFEYDGVLPANHRISSLLLWRDQQWIAVNNDEIYCGVSSSYTIAGKEGYEALLASTDHVDHHMTMADSFIEFIANTSFPITNSTNNRLVAAV